MNYKNRKLLKGTVFINAGINSGCPFCRGLNADIPKVGDIVRGLSDFMSGLIGEVVTNNGSLRPGEFLVKFLEDPKDHQYAISIDYNLFEPSPFTNVPDWAPHISLRKVEELHWYLMNLYLDSFVDGKWKYRNHASLPLIAFILKNRLPIEATELWDILEAHGFPSKWKRPLHKLYKDSKELLKIYHFMDTGRNYRSKKRILPFSMESYRYRA